MGSRKFSEIYLDRTLQIKSLTRLTYFQTCLKTKYFLHYKGKCQVGRRFVQYTISSGTEKFSNICCMYSRRNLESVCNFIFAKKDVVTPFWENGPVFFERYANSSFPCQFRFFKNALIIYKWTIFLSFIFNIFYLYNILFISRNL